MLNNKESMVDLLVDFIEVYKEREKVYSDLNRQIMKVQGDFHSNLEPIDHILRNKLLDVIDYIIENISGNKDLICHILYDTAIIYADSVEYNLKNKDELKKFLLL
jgi:hypothetical protein